MFANSISVPTRNARTTVNLRSMFLPHFFEYSDNVAELLKALRHLNADSPSYIAYTVDSVPVAARLYRSTLYHNGRYSVRFELQAHAYYSLCTCMWRVLCFPDVCVSRTSNEWFLESANALIL